MMKEINVNDFCAVNGIATNTDAEELYNHIKELTLEGTTIVLDFSDIKCVDLSFFKTILPHYFPDTKNLKVSNLPDNSEDLFREALLCVIHGAV